LREMFVRWAQARARQEYTQLKIVFRDGRKDVHIPAYERNILQQQPELSEEDSDTEMLDLDETDAAKNTVRCITITTSDPSFFTNLIISPTPKHYLTIAPELLTSITHPRFFLSFFAAPSPLFGRDSTHRTLSKLRRKVFRWYISHSTIASPPDLFIHPDSHFTDTFTRPDQRWLVWIINMAYFASWAEEAVMWKISAKYVDGGEPWKVWERALRRLFAGAEGGKEREAEGWEDLGSVRYV